MRTILVTGSSRGLGAALATRLLARGEQVIGVSRRGGASVEGSPPQLRSIATDLGEESGIETVVRAVDEPLAGVVFSAAVSFRLPFDAVSHEGVDPLRHQLEQDLFAPLALLRALVRAEKFTSSASVVFVSSNLTTRAVVDKVPYIAAKAGLEGACRALCRELGPRGIRVNAVAPGLMRTDMTSEMPEGIFARAVADTPLGRLGDVEDTVDVILFFLDPASRFVSGQTLVVDGGCA